jgi:hypothetical protein
VWYLISDNLLTGAREIYYGESAVSMTAQVGIETASMMGFSPSVSSVFGTVFDVGVNIAVPVAAASRYNQLAKLRTAFLSEEAANGRTVIAGVHAPKAGLPQLSAGGQVGQTFDPARLESILDRFEQIGGSTIRGEEAARMTRGLGAKAIYFPAEGGPGTLVIPPGATRVQVAEELLHYKQYRARGFPSSDPQSRPLLRLELEVEAQDTLINRIGPRRGWTGPELDELRSAREVWLEALQRAGGSQ